MKSNKEKFYIAYGAMLQIVSIYMFFVGDIQNGFMVSIIGNQWFIFADLLNLKGRSHE